MVILIFIVVSGKWNNSRIENEIIFGVYECFFIDIVNFYFVRWFWVQQTVFVISNYAILQQHYYVQDCRRWYDLLRTYGEDTDQAKVSALISGKTFRWVCFKTNHQCWRLGNGMVGRLSVCQFERSDGTWGRWWIENNEYINKSHRIQKYQHVLNGNYYLNL